MAKRPNLEKDGWELESALDRHLKHPDTFEIPDENERNNLRVGDMVQLLFLIAGEDEEIEDEQERYFIQCEKMWVTVKEIKKRVYVGQLESLPFTSEVIQPGDLVSFKPEHVASIYIRKSDPRHPDYQKLDLE